MTLKEIMIELEQFGDAQTKKTLMKHGAKEPFFGVKVADLKKILKKTKKNHSLSLELYATGNSDAMYLAGLMADENKITEAQLDLWVQQAYWYYLSEFTVPWVAAETPFAFSIGIKWIESEQEQIAAAGWATLASYAALQPNSTLDTTVYSQLLDRVAANIHHAPNRLRYVMNGFVIAIGTTINELTSQAKEVASRIGKIEVMLASSACKVPFATEYINKIEVSGQIGKKRKSARC